jgi:aspartate racemase
MDINVGIIGGMGPKATNQFLDRITELTDADKDQDHVRYILYSDPEIPNRIEAYFDGAETPVEAINKGIDFLGRNGIKTIAIPCNTAHIWFSQFHNDVNLLNMIKLTVDAVIKSGYKKPGFLATTATIKSGLYINQLKEKGIITVIPEDEDKVMAAVQAVKLGDISRGKAILKPVINELKERGSDSIIMACTEIPVILNHEDTTLPLIDSDRILAEEIILAAGKKLKAYTK